LLFNVAIPQLFWFQRVRENIPAVFVISILINVGMWIERILIIWNTLGHGHMVSAWRVFYPTFWDWALLFGTLGFFAFLYLITCRVLPIVSVHETHKLMHRERQA